MKRKAGTGAGVGVAVAVSEVGTGVLPWATGAAGELAA